MAVQSIVDFVKDSLVARQMADQGWQAGPSASAFTRAASTPAMSSAPVSPASEMAYISNASKIIAALGGTDGLTVRGVFDSAGATDFAAFQATIHEMAGRGLLQTVGRDKYGDPIYTLAASPAA